jgi:hypothetical protein
VFNFGLSTDDFAEAVAAFSELLEPSLTGDYNENGVVDAADYVVWRNTFDSMSSLAADGDGSGSIDNDDYLVWREHFGNTLPAPGTANAVAVPEPAGVFLGVAGLLLIVGRSKGRRP